MTLLDYSGFDGSRVNVQPDPERINHMGSEQVASQVRIAVLERTIAVGEVPPAKVISEELGINESAVIEAYRALAEGHVYVLEPGDPTRLRINHDDPGITPPDKLRYDAAVEVPDDFVGAGDHRITVIPGGKYAVAKFRGTNDQVEAAWAALLRDWLPQSGLQLIGDRFRVLPRGGLRF